MTNTSLLSKEMKFEKPFSIQSISKPFVYGLALEDHGEAYVHRKVGVEPTGGAFNSMIKHEQVCEDRFNPMVNMGAVTTTSLIKGAPPPRFASSVSRICSRPIWGMPSVLTNPP